MRSYLPRWRVGLTRSADEPALPLGDRSAELRIRRFDRDDGPIADDGAVSRFQIVVGREERGDEVNDRALSRHG